MNEFKVITGTPTIEVKRLYLPFTFNVDCPTCKTKCEGSLDNNYLSYPALNVSDTFNV